MRVLAAGFALLIAACTQGTGATPTSGAPPLDTTPPQATSTTAPLAVSIEGCAAPQVPFSPLCEAFDLIEEWHVDHPVSAASLAKTALQGLAEFQTVETAPQPRALICAIPDPAFSDLCSAIAVRIEDSSIPVDAAVEQAVINMVDTGLDPFSWYVPKDQVGAFRLNGVVGGVGVLLDANDAAGSRCLRVTPACRLTIVFVLEDNPGAAAGLQKGDIITMVDGSEVDGLGFVEVGSKIAGNESGTVDLVVERNGETIDFTIQRLPLTVPTVEVELPAPGYGYIRIPDFEHDVPGLVHQGLESLDRAGYSTLVLDLRDNPGGFVDSALTILSEFVDQGQVLMETETGSAGQYIANGGGLATDKRLVVLVNGGTASAAEITAAALRDIRSAVVLGKPTFGKNAIQLVFDLRNGAELHLAVARWLSPDGHSVAGTGLVPDHLVDLDTSMNAEDLVALTREYVR